MRGIALSSSDVQSKDSYLSTILVLIGLIPFFGILLYLYKILNNDMSYFGFLFLLYWAGMLRQDLHAFFPSLVGGLLGIGIGWQLIAIPPVAGLIGQIGLGCAMAVVIFCYLQKIGSFFINNATMLYLLLATIAPLRVVETVGTMAESLVLGAAYMGAVTVMAIYVRKHWSERRSHS